MERPIYTLFQIIREDTNRNHLILFDEPKRYYKMLRKIIGVKSGVLKGTDEIRLLYKQEWLWKDLLANEGFSQIDISLMEKRLRSIYNDKYRGIYLLDLYDKSPENILVILFGISYILFMINLLNHIRIYSYSGIKYVFSALYNYSTAYEVIPHGEPIEYYKVLQKTC